MNNSPAAAFLKKEGYGIGVVIQFGSIMDKFVREFNQHKSQFDDIVVRIQVLKSQPQNKKLNIQHLIVSYEPFKDLVAMIPGKRRLCSDSYLSLEKTLHPKYKISEELYIDDDGDDSEGKPIQRKLWSYKIKPV